MRKTPRPAARSLCQRGSRCTYSVHSLHCLVHSRRKALNHDYTHFSSLISKANASKASSGLILSESRAPSLVLCFYGAAVSAIHTILVLVPRFIGPLSWDLTNTSNWSPRTAIPQTGRANKTRLQLYGASDFAAYQPSIITQKSPT